MHNFHNELNSSKAFYFIPDISGFSQFVENTAVEHSIHIISELLEILLDSNRINLKLAEIEGDALFMYSQEEFSFSQIETQISKMLNAFRAHLYKYEHQRICDCGACTMAIDLKIKFFVHWGRLDFIRVKNIKKPYGQDVNRIHRLLKNDVPLDEYILFSNPSIKYLKIDPLKSGFTMMESKYDITILPYYYKDLEDYKTKIENTSANTKIGIDEKADFVIESRINVPIERAYELISNFKYRRLWDTSLTDIVFNESQVNRTGSNHTCIIGNRKMKFETIGIESTADFSYGERTSNLPMANNYRYYILLDKFDDTTTKVKILNYVNLNWMGKILRKSFFHKIKTRWNKKLKKLEEIGLVNQ